MKNVHAIKQVSWLTLLLGLWTGLSSCEDVIDVDLEKGEALLVVDGWITDQPGPYTVRLTYTDSYFSHTAAPGVSGVTVTIADNEGNSDRLQEQTPGVYVTNTLRGKVGNQYTLTVTIGNEEYTAQTTIKRTFPIDSVGTGYQPARRDQKAGYLLHLYGQEPSGVGDTYRLKVFRNDTLLNSPEELLILDDRYIDGNYIRGLALGSVPVVKGDRVRVENHSINDDTHSFYTELTTQMRNGGMFANPPANVRSNIKTTKGSKQAIGWFGGSAVSIAKRVVQ